MAKIQEGNNGKGNTISATTISSWSRQQKLAMLAGFVLLGILLGLSACSKQSKTESVQAPIATQTNPASNAVSTQPPVSNQQAAAVAPKKVHKKRSTTVTYVDQNSGISFRYPRKYELATGEKAEAQFADMGTAPMNFVQPGGTAVATVNMPEASYPGTDFTSAFFNVNVNRGVSEQECSQFAFVDSGDADGESLQAEKVKVGSLDLDKTSNFSGDAVKQAEAQYYHRWESGACYEFVLGLGTEGYGTDEKIKAVNRDKVFDGLEKILASVKIQTIEQPKEEPKVETAKSAETGDPSNK